MVHAVRGVTLTLSPGEIVALMGPSGSGKSSLLNLIGLLDDPDQGYIDVDGVNVANLPGATRDELRGRRMGFIFQQSHMLPNRNVLANVSLGLRTLGEPRKRAESAAWAALERVGLRERALARSGDLSGGERQRIAFARALLSRPDLIVMDEATSALDEESQTRVMQALIDLLPDTTLISVAHRPSLAAFHTRSVALKRLEAGVYLVRGEKPGVLRGVRRILGLLPGRARISARDDGTKTQAGRSEA